MMIHAGNLRRALVVAIFVLAAANQAPAQCLDYGQQGTAPTITTFDLPPGAIQDLALAGDLGWAAITDYGALAALDLSDPYAPQLVSRLDLGVFETYHIAVEGDLAAVSYSNWTSFGILVVDISDPTQPVVLHDYAPGGAWWSDVALRNGILYTVQPNPGALQVLDLADPTQPQLIAQVPLAYGVRYLTLAGDLALVSGESDVYIVGVASPAAAALSGSMPVGGQSECVATTGAWAVVGTQVNGGGGLAVFDCTDPANPVAAGTAVLTGAATDIALDGDIAYVATHRYGLWIYDLSDKAAPVLIGVSDYPDSFAVQWAGVQRVGDALVTDYDRLHIQPLQCALSPASIPDRPGAGLGLTAAPNPFNPVTRIRFTLPDAATVDVDIVDVAGHRVRTLVRGTALPAGRQELTWDGRDDSGRMAASGTYVCRVRAAGAREFRTVTLLK